MYTISQVARRFALSRSTLLYYDRIGLLRPSGRSAADYRLYSEADLARMEQIALYRDAGVPLKAIAELLRGGGNRAGEVLRRRLAEVNAEIAALRSQQRSIVAMLEGTPPSLGCRALDKAAWVALLRASGLDDDDMARWHREFERMAPEAHRDFLESLGVAAEEIEAIRNWSCA